MFAHGKRKGNRVFLAGYNAGERVAALAYVVIVAQHIDAHGVDLVEEAGPVATF